MMLCVIFIFIHSIYTITGQVEDFASRFKMNTLKTLSSHRRDSLVATQSSSCLVLQTHAISAGFLSTEWTTDWKLNRKAEEVLMVFVYKKSAWNSYLRTHFQFQHLLEGNLYKHCLSMPGVPGWNVMPEVVVGDARTFGLKPLDIFRRLEANQRHALRRCSDEKVVIVGFVGIGPLSKSLMLKIQTIEVENRLETLVPETVWYCKRNRTIPLEFFRVSKTPMKHPNSLGDGNDRQIRNLFKIYALENQQSLYKNYVKRAENQI